MNKIEKRMGEGLLVGGLVSLGLTLEFYSQLGNEAWLMVLASALISLAGAGMFKKRNLY